MHAHRKHADCFADSVPVTDDAGDSGQAGPGFRAPLRGRNRQKIRLWRGLYEWKALLLANFEAQSLESLRRAIFLCSRKGGWHVTIIKFTLRRCHLSKFHSRTIPKGRTFDHEYPAEVTEMLIIGSLFTVISSLKRTSDRHMVTRVEASAHLLTWDSYWPQIGGNIHHHWLYLCN